VSGKPSVLFAVHSTHFGGAEILALETARYLSDRAHQLTIAAPPGPMRSQFAEAGDLIEPTPTLPTWGATPLRWAIDLLRTVLDVRRLRRVIRETASEVVLTNTSTTLAPVIAARLAGVPVVVHAREWPSSRLATPLLHLHTRLATTVVVIGRPLLEATARRPTVARVVQINDGIEPRRLAPRTHKAPRGRLTLGVVGGLCPRKGQDLAVSALALLRQAGVDAQLELVGRAGSLEFTAELEVLINALDLTNFVQVLGERSDVHSLMQRWDALLAPSRGDWTPLAIMEAMAVGLPVVATSVGTVPEMLDYGRCGMLVTPGAVDELADAVGELTSEDGATLVRDRVTAARARVLERYDLAPSLDRLAEELARVTVGRPAQG
jgi:glycosyltransferase involved in cell wall biosynthesis